VGGPAFVKNVRGPCPFTDIMATGGVAPNRESLGAWFAAGVACVGMGSNLFLPELVARRDYAGLRARVQEILAMIREVRGAAGKVR
jgi:2-dehydro-3-deoxyphosphogluconate aldolase/(4S)-4-hydroxy-2-oxoglutarate aldolase